MSPKPTAGDLEAEARYATSRVALYRRKLYAGRGDLQHLGELERIAAGARDRHDRQRARGRLEEPTSQDLVQAEEDVRLLLADPALTTAERLALLRRQAELGERHDALERRARRHRDELQRTGG